MGLTKYQIESFVQMIESLPKGSVVISGSTLIQAATGMLYKDSDVDFIARLLQPPMYNHG